MNSWLSGIPVLNKRVKFPVTPHFPGGLVTPQQLVHVADVAAKYGGTVKIAGGNIVIMGLSLADGEAALAELGAKAESFIKQSVRAVTMCAGRPHCPMAKQDSSALGLQLDAEFFGRATPGKVRMGVSGCPNCCAEVFVKDIGMYGTPQGFTLIVGGNAGRQAQVGRVIAEGVPADKVLPIVRSIMDYYGVHGRDKERLGDTFSRCGWEESVAAVVPQEYRNVKS